MNFRTKRTVDFWLGGLFLFLLYVPVRSLGLLLRRDHSLSDRRGCAVIKLIGAGSLFLANPSLQAIRGQFPPGRFFLVGTKGVTDFAESFAWFDRCWTIDDTNVVRLITSTLRALCGLALHCDHVIDLEVHSRLTTVFSVLTGVRNRIGFADEIAFWKRAFYTHMTFFNAQGPVYAFYDMLAAWFGIDRVPVAPVHAAFRASVAAARLPDNLALPRRYVVVAPGCSDFGKERQLHPGEWRKLLLNEGLERAAVVLLGGAADRDLCSAIAAELDQGISLAGQLGIAQSASVLAGAERFFGIDSLMLHLARALRVPSTSIWGPSDPATRLRPGGVEDRVYFARMSCSPCIHVHETPPCNGARACIPAALVSRPRSLGTAALGGAIGWARGPSDPAAHAVEVAYD